MSLETYRKAAEDARLFLEGRNDNLIVSLKGKMQREAEAERFEEAARLRDNVRMLEDLATRQKMAGVRGDESDVFGFYREGSQAVLQVFSIRSGKVVDRDSFLLENIDFHDDAALTEASLKQYYELGRFLPSTIHVPTDFPYREAVADELSAAKGSRVEILVPRRGGKKRLVELVSKNARLAYELDFREEGRQAVERLEELRKVSIYPIGRSASKVSTSRTSRVARWSPRWWSSSAGSRSGAIIASSRSGAWRRGSPTTSPPCAKW